MGEFKIVLGYDDREIRGFKGGEGRTARIYQIVTRDQYCFIINEYEKVVYDDLYEKKNKDGEIEKVMSNVLEINGELYRKYGTEEKSHSDFNRIVDTYIKNWKMHIPNYDITDVKTAIKFFKELNDLKSELLEIK